MMVRLSGNNAISLAEECFIPKNKSLSLTKSETHRVYFGDLMDDSLLLDECLLTVFAENHSYTGEQSVEFGLHASPFILQQLLSLLIRKGARMADPGEFTLRAYLNGKMDLTQAESVADLISSTSRSAHRAAITQLKGNFSKKLQLLRKQLLDFASLIELELDFAEEDVEFADRSRFLILLEEIKTEIETLIHSYKIGNVLKKGVPVAIIGKPNVGKSTLLNALLQEDKAIVSEIAGTTRDVIEDTINIQGVLFRFVDTAGIHNSLDQIEQLGIKRTFQKIEEARIVLLVVDSKEISDSSIEKIIQETKLSIDLKEQELIVLVNKIDEFPMKTNFESSFNWIPISAKSKFNIEQLENRLSKYVAQFKLEDQSIVTNARHLEALQHSHESLINISNGFKDNLPTDLISIDMRTCLYHLGSITGDISTDELLGNIFSHFCIGK
jgi:tRNA modification GTPase